MLTRIVSNFYCTDKVSFFLFFYFQHVSQEATVDWTYELELELTLILTLSLFLFLCNFTVR